MLLYAHYVIKMTIIHFNFPEYLILEQVCIAAADVNKIGIIDQCLYSLHNEFPGSLRVKRLQVLKLELAEK